MIYRNMKLNLGHLFSLAMMLSAIVLGTHPARAAMVDFTVGSQWKGFYQNVEQGGGGGTGRLFVVGGSDSSLIGLLNVFDKFIPVAIEEAGDGSVDIEGIGVNRGLHAHGVAKQTGDGSVITNFTQTTSRPGPTA